MSPLEQRMEWAQKISSLVLSLRKNKNKVHATSAKILIPAIDKDFVAQIDKSKIIDFSRS